MDRFLFLSGTLMLLLAYSPSMDSQEKDLVRLVNATTNAETDTVRGLLEARTSLLESWRKVCSGSRTLTKLAPLPRAACKDLGYDDVVSVTVGGIKLPGDNWLNYNCPADITTLADCATVLSQGFTAPCNKQRLWIWLACANKTPDPSLVACGNGMPINRALKTGEEVTITIKTGKNCKVILTAADPEAVILVRPLIWTANLDCTSGLASAQRLNFRSIVDGKISRTESICSEQTRKAVRGGSQTQVEVDYQIAVGTNPAVEIVTISASAKRQLTCSANQMDIRMLKSDLGFQEDVMKSPRISAAVGPENGVCQNVPSNVDSDVLEIVIGLKACGTTFSVPDRRYRNEVTFTQIQPKNDRPSVVDNLERTRFAFQCTNSTNSEMSSELLKLLF